MYSNGDKLKIWITWFSQFECTVYLCNVREQRNSTDRHVPGFCFVFIITCVRIEQGQKVLVSLLCLQHFCVICFHFVIA